MNAIEIENVSKRFKERGEWFQALKNVTLFVKEGEIFGLLGPNGAGKTTLLNIIIQLVLPDQGTVRILGQDPRRNGTILEMVNFVSGDTKFHWTLRAEDVLNFYGIAYHLTAEERKKRIEKLIGFFDIESVRRRRFSHLSTGEKMRLIFAKAMLNHPAVLLLDEPTLGLDPSIAIRVREEITRVNKEFGTTVLLTSHYMSEVEQLSDRVGFISEGEIVDVGKVEKVKMKHFGTYDVVITAKTVRDRRFLEKNGFHILGTTIRKTLRLEENLSSILSLLHKKGIEILDVETRKPTLEDYFVKIVRERKKV